MGLLPSASSPLHREGGDRRRFPEGFLWGTGTSAYQVEGGVDLDGRGASIWDTFAARGGTRGGADGSVAADHRRRMATDVALLAKLGVPAYRFSVAWPRVQPEGRGPGGRSGLDFYRALVDELLARDIEPVLTLYHWDLPQALEDAGGWPERDTAYRFADYAALVAEALGDRVRHWGTINEPWCAAMLGYAAGVHAPGRTEPGSAAAAAHHLLLGHGLAVDALRARLAPGSEVGITLNPYPVAVGSRAEADLDAARRIDGIANRLWYDPLLSGWYPDDVLDDLATVSDLAFLRDGDLTQIARPLDVLGINYYRRHHVRYRPGASASPSPWPGSPDVEVAPPDEPATANHWRIEPRGLYECLTRVATDYDPPPLVVHENGAAFPDRWEDGGRVADTDRIAYLDGHLGACHDALEAGVDLRGYFVWSFLDNFEWAEGYAHRFGIVHVDFTTQRRTPKASAEWYSKVVAANALSSEAPGASDQDEAAAGRPGPAAGGRDGAGGDATHGDGTRDGGTGGEG